MPFTKSQQGKFRPVVERAWQHHARSAGIDPKSPQIRRAWYEDQLLRSTGFTSTNGLDHGRDFDVAIAHFERLADDGETYWQNRAESGDLRRVLWNVFGKSRPEIDGEPVTLPYLQAIAQQMLRLDAPPLLRDLRKTDLNGLTRALSIYARRRSRVR
jgi:hypothetical protein